MYNGFFSGIKNAIGGAVSGFLTTGDPLGAVIGGATTLLGNASAKHEAQRNRDYQTMMSNTSYQRMMQDLKLAGLNPMLVIDKGNGASTPQGSMAQISNLGSSLLSSSGARRMAKLAEKSYNKDIELKNANIDNINSQTNYNNAKALEAERNTRYFEIREEAQRIINAVNQSRILNDKEWREWLNADTDYKREQIISEGIKHSLFNAQKREILLRGTNIAYINDMLKVQRQAWKNSEGGMNLDFGLTQANKGADFIGKLFNILNGGNQGYSIYNNIGGDYNYIR